MDSELQELNDQIETEMQNVKHLIATLQWQSKELEQLAIKESKKMFRKNERGVILT